MDPQTLTYRARIERDPDQGGWVAEFPDLIGITAYGDSYRTCKDAARDALSDALESYTTDYGYYPAREYTQGTAITVTVRWGALT